MKVIQTNLRSSNLSKEVCNYQIICFDSEVYEQLKNLELPIKPGIENSVPGECGDAFIDEYRCMALNFDFTKVSEETVQIFIREFRNFLKSNHIITQRI